MMKWKKALLAVVLMTGFVVSSAGVAFACGGCGGHGGYGGRYALSRQTVVDQETAQEIYIAGLEARKLDLKDLYEKDLITSSQYDAAVAGIQAEIDHVTENGLDVPGDGSLYYGCGYGYGACWGGDYCAHWSGGYGSNWKR